MKEKAPTYILQSDFYIRLKKLTEKFLNDGLNEFSEDFAGIDNFYKMALEDQSNRDDHSMRRTPKELYLLEALSFQIYDQLNREAFNHTKNTLIIMPDCLSLHNDTCLMTDEKWGDVCQRCHPGCQADLIMELGEKYGAEVVFSKRSLSDQLKHFEDKKGSIGVIGVACLMMLAMGMRTARENEIPARGVLLNYTGCDHWNENCFASHLTIERLESILKEKHG